MLGKTVWENLGWKVLIVHINKKIEISLIRLIKFSVVYIYIPVIIMILGWCRVAYSILCIVLIVSAIFISLRRINVEKKITISLSALFLLFLSILAVGLICGWGGLFPQSYDWCKHNALLRDLIVKEWPVIYSNHGTKSMLTYYMAQYIIPAFAGKILLFFMPQSYELSFLVGEIVMLIWNSLGLLLVTLYVIDLTDSSKPIVTFVLLIFYGSLLPVGRLIISTIYNSQITSGIQKINEMDLHNLNVDMIAAQYTTNFVQLRWVFQQCIVAWLVTSILMEGIIGLEQYVVIGLPLVMFSTFPFIGILPFMFSDALYRLQKERKFIIWMKEIFSVQNLLALLSVGSFSLAFFCGYVFSKNKPDILKLSVNDYTLPGYIIFLLTTFGIYLVLLIPSIKSMINFNSRNFIVAGVLLCILPLYKMGLYNDFTMRVSIPALFILCVAYIKSLLSDKVRKNRRYWLVLQICFLIGISYPAMEMIFVMTENSYSEHQELKDDYYSLEYFANPNLEMLDIAKSRMVDVDMQYNYYTYEGEMHYFIDTIGKVKQNNIQK